MLSELMLRPCCKRCGQPLPPAEARRWGICLSCISARQQADIAGHCVCPRDLRLQHVVSDGYKSWVRCDRCLGVVYGPGRV